jgi:hypothetical protein
MRFETTVKLRRLALCVVAAPILSGCVSTRELQPEAVSATPLVVEFGPDVAREFNRPRMALAMRPRMTRAEYATRNALPKPSAGRAPTPQAYADPDVVAAFLTDRTVLTQSAQHGTQVEYISPNGDTFLWYPGNDTILRGRFAVLWENAAAEIDDPQEGVYRGQVKLSYVCFRYGASSLNPVTGHRGGRFECGAYSRQREAVKESRKGDLFGLAQRTTAPFPLERDIRSLSSLQNRVAIRRP